MNFLPQLGTKRARINSGEFVEFVPSSSFVILANYYSDLCTIHFLDLEGLHKLKSNSFRAFIVIRQWNL